MISNDNIAYQDNILIDDNGSPLLGGFGISRISIDEITLTGTQTFKGNLRWMAIELINSRGAGGSQSYNFHTRESDVWAYGMVIYVRNPSCGSDQH